MPQLVNSADSHLYEPPDLWEERLPKHLRDRAPRMIEVAGRSSIVFEGQIPLAFDIREEAVTEMMGIREGEGSEDATARVLEQSFGQLDPIARSEALDTDGVWGEVIYPSWGAGLQSLEDPELGTACARVYNDFIAECFAGHERFVAAAQIRPQQVDEAVKEIERVANLGLRAIVLPMDAGDRPYCLEQYDPIWAAAQAHNFPVSFHVATSTTGFFKDSGHTAMDTPFTFVSRPDLPPGTQTMFFYKIAMRAQEALGWLAAGGVLARFPDLHVVMVEAGSGWLGYFMERIDEGPHAYPNAQYPKLPEPPSYYIRRQAHVTFSEDRAGLNNLEITGEDALLWGSDYPHSEGTFPHSLEAIDKLFSGTEPTTRATIVGGTAAKLWGLSPS